MKRLLCFGFLVITVLALAACGSTGGMPDGDQLPPGDGITVVDDAGYTVELPARIDRIVVADILPIPSVLAVFFNSADKIVGIPEGSMTAAKNSLFGELYPEILNAETGFAQNGDINLEELLKLDPDLVICSTLNPAVGDKLRNAGFTTVAISPNKSGYDCIETLQDWLELLGQIFPDNDKTAIVTAKNAEIYDLVQSRIKDLPQEDRARIFFLYKYTDTSIMTSGEKFFGQWWADTSGAINVAREMKAENANEVNLEQIYAWNPDMIFISNFTTAMPDDLYNNTFGAYDWSGISAVADKKVFKMPLGIYRSYTPGVDSPVTMLWFAKTIYPELFDDIDLYQETKDYYAEVFNVTLTDKQAKSIFEPDRDASEGFTK